MIKELTDDEKVKKEKKKQEDAQNVATCAIALLWIVGILVSLSFTGLSFLALIKYVWG